MSKVIRIGHGEELHIENPDQLILDTLGSRPLCGGVRINGKAQVLQVTDAKATCTKCTNKAAKLGL